MKVPTEGVCVVPDLLRGDVEIPWDRMDMQVLMKTDGLPTYFLANVDRKSTRLNSSHYQQSRMPSSA